MNVKRQSRSEYREGHEAAEQFDRVMNRVLKVSKEELDKREALYKEKRRAEKPSRRTK